MKKKILLSICIIIILIIGAIILWKINETKTVSSVELVQCSMDFDKVSISVKEGSLTNKGVTLLFTSENEFVYSVCSGPDYQIYRKKNEDWERVKGKDFIVQNSVIRRPATKNLEESIYWEKLYGELSKGTYRLGREISFDDIGTKFVIEFIVK